MGNHIIIVGFCPHSQSVAPTATDLHPILDSPAREPKLTMPPLVLGLQFSGLDWKIHFLEGMTYYRPTASNPNPFACANPPRGFSIYNSAPGVNLETPQVPRLAAACCLSVFGGLVVED